MKTSDLLLKFWGLDKIYGRKYGVVFLLDPLLLIALTVFVLQAATQDLEEGRFFIFFAVFLLGLYYVNELIKALYARHIIRHRNYTLINKLKNTKIYSSAMNTELNLIDSASLINHDQRSGIYDITFNFYRKTKHGEYLAKQAFYTVYEIKLQRILPHLIFDSKSAKGKQFKKFFLQAQRISLDVNFDDYFDVYTPKTYHVDTLSFITPEVLQAMLGIKQYDMEIIDDSLLVFAPLLSSKHLVEFEQQGLQLYHALNDNLETYRDERLLGEYRKSNVTTFSKRLLESPVRFIAPAILSAFASVGAMYVFFKYSPDIRLFIPVVMCSTYVGKIISLTKKNNLAERQFKSEMKLQQTIKDHKSHPAKA